MTRSDFKFIFSSFVLWRLATFLFLFLAIKFVPLQLGHNFLGGGYGNYLSEPWLWSWANFDGEHFLSIARFGYQPLTYFYFPVFPLLARFLGIALGEGAKIFSGLIVSNVSFLLALIGFWKLILLDYKRDVAKLAIVLLLLFPTSFYFGSYYSESIFLALVVWSFYFARTGKWILSGILGGVSTATRIIGAALLPALVLEKKRKWPIVLIPLGIIIYMYYLNVKTGDPFNFLNEISIFGDQRSSSFVLLPQVFYRYFVKILPVLNYQYFPGTFTTYLELASAILFLALSVLAFIKLRASYAIYLALGYLVPTLSGSFSSLPRYVLSLFPGFILLAIYSQKLSKVWKTVLFSLLFIGLAVSTCLFLRGYWVS